MPGGNIANRTTRITPIHIPLTAFLLQSLGKEADLTGEAFVPPAKPAPARANLKSICKRNFLIISPVPAGFPARRRCRCPSHHSRLHRIRIPYILLFIRSLLIAGFPMLPPSSMVALSSCSGFQLLYW